MRRTLLDLPELRTVFSHVPYRRQYLEIRGNDESDIGYFVDEIAPRYGQHIRGLGCSFGTLGEDWQPTRKEQQNNARLRALLAQAIPRLVGVTTLITNIGEDDAHFDPARDALAATAVGFGSQLTMLDISHVGHDDPTIEPMYLAQLLARLPNLEDLTLQDVAGGWKDDVDALLVSIRRLECLQSLTLEHSECFDSRLPLGSWTAPLQHLRINDCCHLPFSDIELFTRHFLTTLESLDISEWDRKFSLALPFNLPNLTSLTLGSGFPITRFPSFPSSPVATLELSVVRGQFDLMDVLTALDGFKSTLKTLSVLEDDVWDEEMLKDVKGYCEAHGIECKLGDMLYCT